MELKYQNQKSEFEKKHQELESEFTTKYNEQRDDFYNQSEKLQNSFNETINTEYRMGCDATPYREDGKNHLIAGLTGFAQNMNWPKYMREYGPGYHPIFVHLVHNELGKIHKGKSLFNPKKRTMIYSYHIAPGEKISEKLDLPFINGETENKLEVMQSNHSFVASSVFTDGISIHNLEQIIEIDFQFGSRQEEMQLSGRLMHSKAKHKAHHIIMTNSEYDSYGKRLYSLQGNGFPFFAYSGIEPSLFSEESLYLKLPKNPSPYKSILITWEVGPDTYKVTFYDHEEIPGEDNIHRDIYAEQLADLIVDKMGIR